MKAIELLSNVKYDVGDLIWVIVDSTSDYHVMRYSIEAIKIYSNKVTYVVVWEREYPTDCVYETREEALAVMKQM